MSCPTQTARCSKALMTKVAWLWMHVANEPFIALFSIFPFILRKDLGASALQISIFVTLKPVVSVFSFYWSSNLTRNRKKLRSNLMGAWLFARLPFFVFPFFDNVGGMIAAFGIYQFFSRAGMPAMMEVLKLNIEKNPREKLFTQVYVLSFIESVCLGLFMGKLLDLHSSTWKFLFFITSALSIATLLIQKRIPLPKNLEKDKNILPMTTNRLIQPIKDCIHLIRSRPDFAHFQWSFMIGGIGLMLIAPALPIYYVDILSLSHHDQTIARCFYMGLGVIGSSFIWKKALSLNSPIYLTPFILMGFSLFPFTLLFAKINPFFINIAFLFYGISQGGSHLLWNLSGTLFAKEEDSSKFSTVNVLMVGIRGLFAPILGGVLCATTGPVSTLVCGCVISLGGVIFTRIKQYTLEKTPSYQTAT